MSRDSQRGKVYAAEHQFERLMDLAASGDGSIEIHGSRIQLPVELRFGTLQSIEDYCNLLLKLEELDVEPIRVRRRQGLDAAHYEGGGVLAIPEAQLARNNWAMRQIVVLHELAHHLSRRAAQPHGPEFCASVLQAVRAAMSPEAAFLLQTLYYEHGVQIAVFVV